MKRSSTIIAVSVLIISLVILFSGCGGTETETTSPKAGQSSSSASQAASGPSVFGASTSSAEPDLEGKKFTPTEKTPQFLTEALAEKKSVLIEFYMNGPVDDQIVTKSILQIRKKYATRVGFFLFSYRDAEKYGSLAEELNISSTPATIIINGEGKIIRFWVGFVDEKAIEQGIFDSLNN